MMEKESLIPITHHRMGPLANNSFRHSRPAPLGVRDSSVETTLEVTWRERGTEVDCVSPDRLLNRSSWI